MNTLTGQGCFLVFWFSGSGAKALEFGGASLSYLILLTQLCLLLLILQIMKILSVCHGFNIGE